MQMTDIKPSASLDPKARVVEWQKLIHVAATLILQENQKQRLENQKPDAKLNWSHCGDAAETFKLIARAAEWMGITPEQIQHLANELK